METSEGQFIGNDGVHLTGRNRLFVGDNINTCIKLEHQYLTLAKPP